MFSSAFIKKAALSAGFDICGIAANRNLDAERGFFESWLAQGKAGSLGYLHRNLDKRLAPGLMVDNARSIIVCGVSYKNKISGGYPEDWPNPKITSYALARDYHETIKRMLRQLAASLEAEYGGFGFRVFCDSAPILEKRWAIEAGLGWQARNSIVINPQIGSFFFLGELVADVETDLYDTPYNGPGCGECRRCTVLCPTKAITADHGIDARRCISRATIEHYREDCGKEIVKTPLHGWIYGCDICQSSCPYNAAAPEHNNPAFAPLFDPRGLTREYWLSLSEDKFKEKFGPTSMYRTGLSQLRRNLE